MKAVIATILLICGFGAFVLWNANRPVGGAGSALFVIEKGDSVTRIGAHLQDAHLIRSATLFRFTAWSRGDQAAFKAGSFDLSPGMTTRDMERALAGGTPISNERSITVIEGWALRDIAVYLSQQGLASPAAFASVAGTSAKPAKELTDLAPYPALSDKPKGASLEGYLFPDTYRIYKNSTPEAIVRRMLQGFEDKFTPDLRDTIARQHRTIFEIVTMASVLEREVRSDADRAMVADLFWRRIGIGQAMQADSTVNYCTGKSLASVTRDDTAMNCLWNTYKYRGLPAGPIGNPGMSAIRAAIYPSPNPYWYFLTDMDGNVHYAKTLDEHNSNKRKYLR